MGKKNMDILLGNILGNAAIKPQDRYEEPAAPLPENDAPAPSTKATTKLHGPSLVLWLFSALFALMLLLQLLLRVA
mgnify:CR=1 FL=1